MTSYETYTELQRILEQRTSEVESTAAHIGNAESLLKDGLIEDHQVERIRDKLDAAKAGLAETKKSLADLKKDLGEQLVLNLKDARQSINKFLDHPDTHVVSSLLADLQEYFTVISDNGSALVAINETEVTAVGVELESEEAEVANNRESLFRGKDLSKYLKHSRTYSVVQFCKDFTLDLQHLIAEMNNDLDAVVDYLVNQRGLNGGLPVEVGNFRQACYSAGIKRGRRTSVSVEFIDDNTTITAPTAKEVFVKALLHIGLSTLHTECARFVLCKTLYISPSTDPHWEGSPADSYVEQGEFRVRVASVSVKRIQDITDMLAKALDLQVIVHVSEANQEEAED